MHSENAHTEPWVYPTRKYNTRTATSCLRDVLFLWFLSRGLHLVGPGADPRNVLEVKVTCVHKGERERVGGREGVVITFKPILSAHLRNALSRVSGFWSPVRRISSKTDALV